jgi:hypothetical protein
VTGRIEPATPRVSDGRSTGLSYGHARWAEPESNRRPPPYQRGALPPELSAEWARLGSNQQPLVRKTSALPFELLARASAPGQGVEPRSPRSERGVLPVRRSRNGRTLADARVPAFSRETRRAASHARAARCSSAHGASTAARSCCDPDGERNPSRRAPDRAPSRASDRSLL